MPALTPLRLTLRDRDILAALERSHLTVQQLLKLSVTFATRFTSERRVQARLRQLSRGGLVRQWPYATTGAGGALHYFAPSLAGYRFLRGEDAPLPSKSVTGAVALSRQEHTRGLA